MWSPHLEPTEGLAVAAIEFAAAIREERAPLTDGDVGLDVIRALAAAQGSLEQAGAFVTV